MSSILYSMINDRAKATYDGTEIAGANYEYWVRHWFVIAQIIRSEFINEGLFKTAEATQYIVDEQRMICIKYLGE